jgi:hypothetical protein
MTVQQRATLNRLLAHDESDLTVDDLLRLPPSAVSLLCLLAKSQQALGEIVNQPKPHPDCGCFGCKTSIKIARKHYKGGE